MFESQSLFKSINCPYFSPTTNTLSCERVYCPFKHPNPNQTKELATSTISSNTVTATQTYQAISQEQKKPEPTKATLDPSVATNLTQQLPNVLENLSNALQTIQDLIKQNQIQTNPAVSATESKADISSTIVNQLNNLSNVILSTVPTTSSSSQSSTEPDSNSLKKSSSSSSLKRQRSVPEYNPTPITELKKLKPETPKRQQSATESTDNSIKKLKTEPTPAPSPSASVSTENKPKCDLVTFSKLSLSQQVLKRYEMLNKEPPTSAAILEAKLRKKQAETATNNEPKKEPNVPHLILDTAANATLRVPLVMRQKFLRVIFDNCKEIYQPIEKACEKAAENEKSIYDRSKNKQIYSNLAAILIKSLRSEMVQLQNAIGAQKNSPVKVNKPTSAQISTTKINNLIKNKPSTPISAPQSSYSHEAMLNGSKAAKCSYSINKTKQLEYKDLSVTQLYQMFYAYVLSEKQLEDNSFPKWMQVNAQENYPRLAYIPNFTQQSKNSTEKSAASSDSSRLLTKTCKRCTKNFYLNSKDMSYAAENSECVYHWGKLRSVRVNKCLEQVFPCCSGGANSVGCEEGKHVYDGEYDGHGLGINLTDYVETHEASTPLDLIHSKTSKNVFALDCEMCYTTKGLEVTRVSIVDLNFKTVYESLVKPDAQILDYNTRWSGLTESSLRNCNKKLRDVQADLLKLINKDSILIGHSLDSDFKALKLIHKNVIDTSVVFPHKMGPPFKRALRNLMSEYLQRIIQEDAEGHDSKEDATSCVHLMIWKINEDLKSNKNQPIIGVQNNASLNCYKVNNVLSVGTSQISKSSSVKVNNYNNNNNGQQSASNLLLSQVKAKMAESQYKQKTVSATTSAYSTASFSLANNTTTNNINNNKTTKINYK